MTLGRKEGLGLRTILSPCKIRKDSLLERTTTSLTLIMATKKGHWCDPAVGYLRLVKRGVFEEMKVPDVYPRETLEVEFGD